MPKMIVSIDGVVIKEVQLTKDRTTLGRRPYNDIVIDNLAVSGEHAVLQMSGNEVYLEDLNSTNGTYINGKAIKKQLLVHNDTVEIGKYRIKYLVDEVPDEVIRDVAQVMELPIPMRRDDARACGARKHSLGHVTGARAQLGIPHALIVDGTAELRGEELWITPTGAILHIPR